MGGGIPMKEPVRLHKQDTTSHRLDFEAFLQRYAPYILLLLIIVLSILIIALIVAMASHGSANVTTMDSNNYYYHLKDVI